MALAFLLLDAQPRLGEDCVFMTVLFEVLRWAGLRSVPCACIFLIAFFRMSRVFDRWRFWAFCARMCPFLLYNPVNMPSP